MKGLHILQIDGEFVEVVQVDDKYGYKTIMYMRCPDYAEVIEAWHWEILKEMNQCLTDTNT